MTFLGAFIFVCLCNCLSVFSAYGENLRIKSLKVTKKGSQNEFYLGHPIILTGKLSSDETVEDVGINFYIIEKGKESEENAYYFIGFYYIAKLKAGTIKFKVEAQLPTDATAGNYYVVGVIDPLDMTEESNDEDNDYKTKKTIKLSDEYIDTPDLIVKDFLLDLDAFPVYKEDASIDESGGSSIRPKIRNNILSNGTVESTDLYDAQIKGTLIVSSSATSSDGVSIRFTLQYQGEDICPLWVWDSSENTYKNEYVVDELPENESVSIPIDLLIPPNSDLYETVDPDNSGMYTVEDIITQIEEQGESYTVEYEEDEGEEGEYEDEYKSEYEGEETKGLGYTIKVEIDPDEAVDEYDDESVNDNIISKKVLLFNVSSLNDTGSNAKRSPKQGDTTEESDLLEFERSYQKYFGGTKNDFLKCGLNFLAKTSLDSYGAQSDVNFSIPVTLLGEESKLINIEGSAIFSQQDSEQSSFEFVIKLLGETIYEESTLDVDWSYPVEQPIYSGTYRGYVIPIKFTVTASGEVSLKGTAEVLEKLDISITPSLEIGIKASAEADAFGFASVSLNGESTLIKDELTITNTGSLELNEDEEVTNGELSFRIENDLYGPEGELYATASWVVRWLNWSGEKTWPLTNWKLWHRNDTLFDKTESIEF